jgi:hypothetical protein
MLALHIYMTFPDSLCCLLSFNNRVVVLIASTESLLCN